MYIIESKYSRIRPSKIWGRLPLKNLKGYSLPNRPHTPSNFFKGCLPQILLSPFLNTLSHVLTSIDKVKDTHFAIDIVNFKSDTQDGKREFHGIDMTIFRK